MNQTKVIIYGGNGFVGTHIAKSLVDLDAAPVCISRTGTRPLYLQDQAWSEQVKWCQGDASEPKMKSLENADVVICAVGSPPVPTPNKAAWDKQFFMNGTANINALDAAAQAGVKRAVLIGAQIIAPLRTDKFAYYKGKRMACEAAKRFSEHSEQQTAVVFEPSIITGKRRTTTGKTIPMNILSPLKAISSSLVVDVEHLASRVAKEALNTSPSEKFEIISNRDI